MNESRQSPQTVVLVDDDPDNLMLMSAILKPRYRVLAATSGEQALALAARETPPDLILLDILMPGLSGYEVCERLKAAPTTAHIPVIFLTAKSAMEDEETGFRVGALDYITKPVSTPILLARVHTHLSLKAAQDRLRNQNASLEAQVERRTRQISALQDATIMALASLAETRDNETGFHLRRTQCYIEALARKLCNHPRFRHALSEEDIVLLKKSAPLHDIGKVGIPDRILLKPDRLIDDEWAVMRTHPALGGSALKSAEELLDAPTDFLRFAREIAEGHHERWDGGGYPLGLAGEAIPVSARLMAVADVYDALISRRVYKPAYLHEEAVEYIRNQRGRHFDPDVADAFLELAEEFRAIARRYADPA